jgi:hypothetical protein
VLDVEAARADLVARGIDVSEVFHDAGGVFHHAGIRAEWRARIRNAATMAPSPRSAIPTATAGCCRR